MPVMLNSMKKRDSNYCPETIRGLLSKTSCPSKLMDQQSTAVSFPVPFSRMSVLSNHLTLAVQAGSVQLARSLAPGPFHWSYNKQLHLYIKRLCDCLWHEDLKPLPQANAHWSHSSHQSSRFYHVCMRQATPRVETTSFTFPICLLLYPLPDTFQIHGERPQSFCKNNILKCKDQDPGGSALHMWDIPRSRDFCWGQRMRSGSKVELGKATMVFPFIFLTKWRDANFGKWSQITLYYLVNLLCISYCILKSR